MCSSIGQIGWGQSGTLLQKITTSRGHTINYTTRSKSIATLHSRCRRYEHGMSLNTAAITYHIWLLGETAFMTQECDSHDNILHNAHRFAKTKVSTHRNAITARKWTKFPALSKHRRGAGTCSKMKRVTLNDMQRTAYVRGIVLAISDDLVTVWGVRTTRMLGYLTSTAWMATRALILSEAFLKILYQSMAGCLETCAALD